MPPSSSFNRYSVLSGPEVRIEMGDLSQIQQSALSPQPNPAHAAERNASSVSLPLPVRLETKPPPRRGMSWPIFTVKKSLDVQKKLHEEWQKTRAAMEPELHKAFSLVEVSDCVQYLETILTFMSRTSQCCHHRMKWMGSSLWRSRLRLKLKLGLMQMQLRLEEHPRR